MDEFIRCNLIAVLICISDEEMIITRHVALLGIFRSALVPSPFFQAPHCNLMDIADCLSVGGSFPLEGRAAGRDGESCIRAAVRGMLVSVLDSVGLKTELPSPDVLDVGLLGSTKPYASHQVV